MSEATVAFRQVAASPELREKGRMRSGSRHDEAQALHNAERMTRLEIEQSALRMSLSIGEIIKLTGLTREETESLQFN